MVTLVSSSSVLRGDHALQKETEVLQCGRAVGTFLTESVNLVAMVTDINSTEVGQICRNCRMKIDRNPMYTEHPNLIPPKVFITKDFAV